MKQSNWIVRTALCLAAAGLCACGQTGEPVSTAASSSCTVQEKPMNTEQLLADMTDEQKVGQLFLVRPDALDLSRTQQQIDDANAPGVTELTDAMRETLTRYPVGGTVFFGKNIENPDQLRTMTAELGSAGAIPLFIAVDEEGGRVARLANTPGFDLPRYESAAAVGAENDLAAAREMGFTIGTYLRDYGFNLDFAPVADLNTNPANPVIGKRAFGSDPDTVATLVGAVCDGFEEAGIACTLKHFPGHGDTADDTHTGSAVIHKTMEELKSCELVPFARNLEKAPLIMAAHIAVPEVTGNDTPASLSEPILTGLLRQELGFSGVIVTDSLSMQAITDHYTPGEAAVQAILAGADILLMPANLPEAFDAVNEAVQDGTISRERLDESVHRILVCKEKYDILTFDER